MRMDQQQWDERYAIADLVWSAEPNRFVAAELAALAPGRALDLGAGEGRNAIWLAERGWQVTAVDFSAVGLGKAAKLAASRGVNPTWVQADLLEYEPEQAAYDLVLVAYLHLTAASFADVLRRASAALAPGGTLLVVGHDRDNIAQGYGGPQDPGILHTAESVVAALPGLRIVRAEQVRRPVHEDGPVAIDTVVRAERS
ncbi:MAG TPA: class I SAM-dependent methyltransferase [Streptosporangiaceae bacterium]|nr:class I SAM-dependent methyltransferase [Streptosporangiaceae bacterium]